MRMIVLIAHNLRSTHNVGSLLRTAEGLGVAEVILTGYTPYPIAPRDERLPHVASKLDAQIRKTALGAEQSTKWSHETEILPSIDRLKKDGYEIIALEQANDSVVLPQYRPHQKVAIILGREVEGLEEDVRQLADKTVEIPMFGQKESFNVVQAAAMAMYHCRFSTF